MGTPLASAWQDAHTEGLQLSGARAVALKGLVKMVNCVLATSKTKPRGEKTINKATMLRLLKWKTAVSEGNFGCPLVPQAAGRMAATPPA